MPRRRPAALSSRLAEALLGGAALFGAAAAQAQDTVPLCFTDFPPYVSTDLPDGGSLGALARRAFTAAGLTIQVVKAPWARAFTMARNGECLLMAVWRNEERDQLFRYSLPVARMQLGFFVRADRGTAPLPAYASVAVERGSYMPPELTAGKYQLNPVVDRRPALQMLRLGRVDAAFSERASFEHLLARDGITNIRWLAPAVEVKAAHMAIAKSHPQADAWLELLDREIRQSVRN